MHGSKTCTKCKEVKLFSEFYKHKKTKDGLKSQCKSCIIENQRKYYIRKHRNEIQAGKIANDIAMMRHEKKCTQCNELKPFNEFYKMKKGKLGLNPKCKKCVNLYHKKYNQQPHVKERQKSWRDKYQQRPEVKERHRIQMAEWRKNNPEKALEVSRRSYKRNGSKQNEKRRERYNNDPEYRKKKLKADREYTKSGRRKELYRKNAAKERARTSQWAKNNRKKVLKYERKYRKDVWVNVERRNRENLADSYVIAVLKKQMNYSIDTQSIPRGLINLKRQSIKLKRLIKQKKDAS